MTDVSPDEIAEGRALLEEVVRCNWLAVRGDQDPMRNWPIAVTAQTGWPEQDWWVTTDGVHASEFYGGAEACARLIAWASPERLTRLLDALEAVPATPQLVCILCEPVSAKPGGQAVP